MLHLHYKRKRSHTSIMSQEWFGAHFVKQVKNQSKSLTKAYLVGIDDIFGQAILL